MSEPKYYLVEGFEVVEKHWAVVVRAWSRDQAERSVGWANRAQTIEMSERSDGDLSDTTEFETLEALLQEVEDQTGVRPAPSVLVDAVTTSEDPDEARREHERSG